MMKLQDKYPIGTPVDYIDPETRDTLPCTVVELSKYSVKLSDGFEEFWVHFKNLQYQPTE